MSSIAQAIIAEAQRQGLDPALAIEVARRESGMNPNAPDGAAGEIGMFQLMPATAAGLGVNPRDPQQNIVGGVSLLRQLVGKYGDPAKALAAYNWGPGSAANPRLDAVLATYGADWFAHIPGSTQGYVTDILGNVQGAYTASFNPAQVFASGATMNVPPAGPAPSSGLWVTLAVAAAVLFGLGFVLEES